MSAMTIHSMILQLLSLRPGSWALPPTTDEPPCACNDYSYCTPAGSDEVN